MPEQIGLFQRGPAEAMYDRGAVISPDGLYRYRLWRIWDDDLAPCAFVMLNPSTADASTDDPTIRRCVGFARSWGAGGLVVVNLFAYRTSDPAELVRAAHRGVDIAGPKNEEHLRAVFSVVDSIVVGWGASGAVPARGATVHRLLAMVPRGVEVCSLGTTREGHPKHPLYLRADTRREPFGTHT